MDVACWKRRMQASYSIKRLARPTEAISTFQYYRQLFEWNFDTHSVFLKVQIFIVLKSLRCIAFLFLMLSSTVLTKHISEKLLECTFIYLTYHKCKVCIYHCSFDSFYFISHFERSFLFYFQYSILFWLQSFPRF